MEKLNILFSDEDIVAVHKPSGLLVHRSPIDRRETRFALQIVRDQLGERVFPVHRLDKPTSGILLFARSRAAAGYLGTAFTKGVVEKRYLAVVRGIPPEEGIIDHPLVEEPEVGGGRPDPVPREAVTTFRRLASVELPTAVGRYATSRYSLIEARPVTGRRHQIRRHLKHIFHPLVGDTKYGEGRHNRFFRESFDCRRLLLAAVEVTFPHPDGAVPVTVTAPPEGSFAAILKRFGWREALPHRWRPAEGAEETSDP